MRAIVVVMALAASLLLCAGASASFPGRDVQPFTGGGLDLVKAGTGAVRSDPTGGAAAWTLSLG